MCTCGKGALKAQEGGYDQPWRTKLENWDTLRSCTLQREHAIEELKGASADIGTGPQL